MKYLFTSDKKTSARARKSYADRTGMTSRANVIMVAAVIVPVEKIEDENGNVMRVWKANEMQRFTNSDIASCLINRSAVEPNEMLGTIPPSGIKYAVTKGWLAPNASRTLYRVTMKGAIDLDLPLRFKGQFAGRKIPFLVTSGPAVKAAK
jgi:hypothetical protein